MSGEARPLASLYPFTVPQWQIDVMEAADANGLLSIHVRSVSPEKVFQPNKFATRAEVFGFVYQVLLYRDDVQQQDTQDTQNTMEGIFQDNGNGTSTYLSYPKDFLITLPADTIHDIEEEMLSSDGSGSVTGVSGYIDGNRSKIVFVVGRDPCPGQCNSQFTQQSIQEFQQSVRQDGQNISDL